DGNAISGNGQFDGNVISGNGQSGIAINDTTGAATNTSVEGNLIGTDLSGTARLGNGAYGVEINGSSGNTIGGPTGAPGTGMGNGIWGNAQAGVLIFNPSGLSVTGNDLFGNLIGTDRTGKAAIANGSDGVEIFNASGNLVGGSTAVDRNIISGNSGNG